MDPAVNGAVQPDAPPPRDQDVHIHVLVTAFGLFAGAADVNPSWEIARKLPTTLTSASSHTDPVAPSSTPAAPQVKIHLTIPAEPVPVTYNGVREFIATTYDPAPHRFDIVLHLGVATPRTFYTLEKNAHRDGYTMPDALGKFEDLEKRPDYWARCPEVMETRIDCQAAVERVREDVGFDEVGEMGSGGRMDEERSGLGEGENGEGEGGGKRVAVGQMEVTDEMTGKGIYVGLNAGYYLCDYIFFSSLAYFDAPERRRPEEATTEGRPERLGGRRRERGPLVDFLHVPVGHDEKALNKGREVVMSALWAIVRAEVLSEKGYPLKASVAA